MTKNKKLFITVVAVALSVGFSGFYVHRSFAATSTSLSTAMYGIELNYPENWKQSPYQFYVERSTKKPGMIITSHDQKINLAVSPKYVGSVHAEDPESAAIKTKIMLVSSTKLKDMPGVSAVRLVTYNYGVPGVADYVASSSLMTDSLLAELNLQQGKLVEVGHFQATIKASTVGNEVAVGFNSQEPLNLAQAITWLQSPEAKTGYAILLSAKPSIIY